MSPSRASRASAGAGSSNRSPAPADKLKLAPARKLKGEIQAMLADELRSEEHRNA